MIRGLISAFQSFRGTGEAALTIPPLDGAFLPNQAIEEAPCLLASIAPDNLVEVAGVMEFSSGTDRLRIEGDGTFRLVESLSTPIIAMASNGKGQLAIATRGVIRIIENEVDLHRIDQLDKSWPGDVTALCFADVQTLLICIGSHHHAAEAWPRDLMERGASGSVWRYDLGTGTATCLARQLAYPWGVTATPDGAVLVAEAWRHRLLRIDKGGAVKPVLNNLAGYPSRLIPRAGGGYWLAISAPRNQLVEFVLRESRYREEMMATIAMENWIAPALAPPKSFLQPMQQGSQRVLGMLKPWAPSFSYGLVVRLDANAQPVDSFHSRADGRRHGITSLIEWNGKLVVASKGGDAIVELSLVTGA